MRAPAGERASLEALRSSVLGSRHGSPRRGRKCVLMAAPDAARPSAKNELESHADPIEWQRGEFLGSRHGTPLRYHGHSTAHAKEQENASNLGVQTTPHLQLGRAHGHLPRHHHNTTLWSQRSDAGARASGFAPMGRRTARRAASENSRQWSIQRDVDSRGRRLGDDNWAGLTTVTSTKIPSTSLCRDRGEAGPTVDEGHDEDAEIQGKGVELGELLDRVLAALSSSQESSRNSICSHQSYEGEHEILKRRVRVGARMPLDGVSNLYYCTK